MDGLYLKTLNDAKSAYACSHFQPSFFERCSSPPFISSASRRSGGNKARNVSDNKKRRHNDDEMTAGTEDTPNQTTFTCRVPLRTIHSVLRSRKSVRSLRIRSYGNSEHHQDDDEETSANGANPKMMQLSFEYILESQQHSNAMIRIVHRMGVAECDSIMAVVSSTVKEDQDSYSEIVSSPTLFTKMLDPLRKTAEIVFTVHDGKKQISIATFHPGDVTTNVAAAAGDANALLLPTVSSTLLKSETFMGCDEFEGYTWRNNEHYDNKNSSRNGDGNSNSAGQSQPPENIKEEVNLVFGIREVKALLHFCSSVNLQDHDMKIVMSFQYGGKPLVFESAGKYFTVQLIMATLNHKLLRRRT